MGFFSRLFSSNKVSAEEEELKIPPELGEKTLDASSDYIKQGLDRPMDEDEKGFVSAIVAAIAAGDSINSEFVLKNITAIDEEKLVAVLSVSGMIANENAAIDSNYVLKSVKEIRKD